LPRFIFAANHRLNVRIPCPQEGRVATVTKRWARGAMGV
jgi:hypothetical protein